ncbi:MAG: trypsin-like peptidase domain-containing protein [Leptolyngbyaceae cyanobacterium SM2_5_2]|nr:trypsin-like peptidase domain-containing protein [Leptolyngbyaceae cyanobacterium SM2_5_2]
MNAQTLELGQELGAIAHHLRQSTVRIQGPTGSSGSGMLWNAQGLIVTNAHVVPQRRAWTTLATGQRLAAHRVGYSQTLDLAALQIESASTIAATELEVATVCHAKDLRVGQMVMAVGHPQGNPGAVVLGIIHAKPPIPRWVQANIQLAPGYSGGPWLPWQAR